MTSSKYRILLPLLYLFRGRCPNSLTIDIDAYIALTIKGVVMTCNNTKYVCVKYVKIGTYYTKDSSERVVNNLRCSSTFIPSVIFSVYWWRIYLYNA